MLYKKTMRVEGRGAKIVIKTVFVLKLAIRSSKQYWMKLNEYCLGFLCSPQRIQLFPFLFNSRNNFMNYLLPKRSLPRLRRPTACPRPSQAACLRSVCFPDGITLGAFCERCQHGCPSGHLAAARTRLFFALSICVRQVLQLLMGDPPEWKGEEVIDE